MTTSVAKLKSTMSKAKNDGSPGEVESTDKYRLSAAVSFAVMLLLIGIPLWWKTTEVHRAALPYDQIESMNPSEMLITVELWVVSDSMSQSEKIVDVLKPNFKDCGVYHVMIMPIKMKSDSRNSQDDDSLLNYEDFLPIVIKGKGLILAEVPHLNDSEIYLTNDRTIYFTQAADLEELSSIVKIYFLKGEGLKNAITSIVTPQVASTENALPTALRASLNYDVILSIVNSDPGNLDVNWDVAADLNRYFQPLLNQIELTSSYSLKSQWLYLIDFGDLSRMDSAGVNVISYSQLPHIITPLEKKLGSGISKNPCVHLILYVVSCSVSPLKFLSESGDYVDSMISPYWGGIQLLNPSIEHCQNRTPLIPPRDVLGIFTSQFHSLLGLHPMTIPQHIEVKQRIGPLLRAWELDGLYRARAIEQITSASLTLQSLSKLLGEIGNIVINEDVANSINLAVKHVYEAKLSLAKGDLFRALDLSKSAFKASEKAFSDPSLLALLYFPDDQKYAVYIPLFLPIMIPVLMSLKKIYSSIAASNVADSKG